MAVTSQYHIDRIYFNLLDSFVYQFERIVKRLSFYWIFWAHFVSLRSLIIVVGGSFSSHFCPFLFFFLCFLHSVHFMSYVPHDSSCVFYIVCEMLGFFPFVKQQLYSNANERKKKNILYCHCCCVANVITHIMYSGMFMCFMCVFDSWFSAIL